MRHNITRIMCASYCIISSSNSKASGVQHVLAIPLPPFPSLSLFPSRSLPLSLAVLYFVLVKQLAILVNGRQLRVVRSLADS